MIHFGVVSPFVLLIALMASPMLGLLFAATLAQSTRISPSLRALAWLPMAVGAGAALIAAWLLCGQPAWEAIVGDWSPISFTGLPLVMAGFIPSTAVLVAWVAVYFVDSLKLPGATLLEHHPAASALLVATLAVTALANNFITLLVGLGLTDLLTAYLALRRQAGERAVLIGLMLNGLSIALLTLVVAVHAAEGNSLYLPIARLTPSAAPALALAIALRLGFAPFRTSPRALGDMRMTAGAVGGLLLLVRLPTLGITRLPEWFYGLALASALLTLAIAILQADAHASEFAPYVATSGAYLAGLSAALATPGVTAAAAVAWLVGVTLVNQEREAPAGHPTLERARRIIRGVGALCLIGMPLTVGFIGQAGVVATWTGRGTIGWLLAPAWVLSLALITYALLGIILDQSGRGQQERLIPDHGEPSSLGSTAREAVGWLAALAPIAIFGLAPNLLAAGSFADALGRHGITGWAGWGIAIAAGALLWRLEPRWRPMLQPIGHRAAGILELGWLYDLLGGAAARLRSPFGRVFGLLESDGSLLWAIIVALLLVLISRPGGP